jgi:molybdopterin-guanine dinucleotide biosynthesis protein A
VRTAGCLGVVSAGGQSSRFGSPKALAVVGGRRVADRAADALAEVTGREQVVAIANDPAIGEALGLPFRPDVLQGAGALAGVHSALLWAQELGMAGALVAGCDMPFLSSALLAELLSASPGADAVLPCSDGPRGVEPLCAWYGTSCIPAIEAAVRSGDGRMVGFHETVRVQRMPLEQVRRHGDPSRLFMNINRPADLEAADAMAREAGRDHA